MNEILIDFKFDPNLQSKIHSFGIEVNKHPEGYVEEYLATISKEWPTVALEVAGAFESVFGTNFYNLKNPVICHVLQSRVQEAENLFIEAYSDPLQIWAIPPNEKWGYLPFYSRLIHEFIHYLRPYIWPGIWEITEDIVLREYGQFTPLNYNLLEELVVRKFTYKINSHCFGQEFADWFSEREASFEALLKHPAYHHDITS